MTDPKPVSSFRSLFGREATASFSVPGRTELGGNHTDHQLGRVLAAGVDADTTAVAAPNIDGFIRVLSEGFPLIRIDLNDPHFADVRPEEKGTSAALVRGVAATLSFKGPVRGFDATVSSRVLPGSGLSSSASFEVLIAAMVDRFSSLGATPLELAMAGQTAENLYFGKPCGLMDQIACATGGAVKIDFATLPKPVITPVKYDFSACGHALCLVDCGAGHADLTEEYASVTDEMKAVCAVFGKTRLIEVAEDDFYARIKDVRTFAGDRAALRAKHIFEENRRVDAMSDALAQNDFPRFLSLVTASGISSAMLLQNVIPTGQTRRQALALTLALIEHALNGRGACRVHGGGFAGTALAFVPEDMLGSFTETMDAALFPGACRQYRIRPEGILVTPLQPHA